MSREKCHPKPIIDKWIKDVSVEVWNNQKSIDMEKYGPDPTYENDYRHNIYLLDKERSRTDYIYISEHIFDNVDSYWPFSSTTSGTFY